MLAQARWCGVLALSLYNSFTSCCQSLKLLQLTSPCITVSLNLEDTIG
jgi:hypothetical protein